jgi:hypothetical protein
MDAEGLQYNKPLESEIIELLNNEGFEALNIDIGYDSLMKLWYWTADIKEIV